MAEPTPNRDRASREREPLPVPGSATLPAWARHKGVARRIAHEWADRASDALPVLRLSARTVLVDLDRAEEWLSRQDARQRIDVGSIVDSIVAELNAAEARSVT